MLDLAHIRKLAEHAQPGPWCVTNSLPDKSLRTEAGWEVCYFPYSDALGNMDFIAAARELVPAMADEIARLREHAHICADLLDANEALGHSLTSARGEIERLRRRVAELEADPNDVRLPDQAKPLCSDMHTEPGMKGFYLCKLNPGHGGHHMSGDKRWPAAGSGEAVRTQ